MSDISKITVQGRLFYFTDDTLYDAGKKTLVLTSGVEINKNTARGMALAFLCGFSRGKNQGIEELQTDIKGLLGISEQEDLCQD